MTEISEITPRIAEGPSAPSTRHTITPVKRAPELIRLPGEDLPPVAATSGIRIEPENDANRVWLWFALAVWLGSLTGPLALLPLCCDTELREWENVRYYLCGLVVALIIIGMFSTVVLLLLRTTNV